MSALFFILLNEKVTIFSHVRRCREDEYLELACHASMSLYKKFTDNQSWRICCSVKKKQITNFNPYVLVCDCMSLVCIPCYGII